MTDVESVSALPELNASVEEARRLTRALDEAIVIRDQARRRLQEAESVVDSLRHEFELAMSTVRLAVVGDDKVRW